MKLFEEVYLDLEAKILDGTYEVGTFLPNEHDLAYFYGVSRETVRKAQRRLVENGLLAKRQGYGSYVLNPHRISLPLRDVEVQEALYSNPCVLRCGDACVGFETTLFENKVVSFHELPESLQLKFKRFGCEDFDSFIYLVRVHSLNDEVMVVDESYTAYPLVSIIPHSFATGSLYRYFDETLGLKPEGFVVDVTPDRPTSFVAGQMKLAPLDFVLTLSRRIFSRKETDKQFLCYSKSYYRLNRFAFFNRKRKRSTPK